jgi:hypothetical protein
MMTDGQALRIRHLNDAFRSTLSRGRVFFTAGVSEKGVAFSTAALAAVRAFSDFTADNNPYGEHDFGSFVIASEKLF